MHIKILPLSLAPFSLSQTQQRCQLVDLTYNEHLTENLTLRDLNTLEWLFLSGGLNCRVNQFVEDYDAVLTELRSFQEGGIISRAAAREAVEARRGGAPASAPRGAFDAGSAVGYGSRRNLREEHRRIEEWEVAKEMLGRMRLSSIYEDKKRTRARRQQVVRWSQAQKDLAAAREVEKQQQRMLAQHASSATSSVASRSWPDDIDGLLANASRPPRPKSSNDNEMPSNEEYNRASASTSAEVAAPEKAMREMKLHMMKRAEQERRSSDRASTDDEHVPTPPRRLTAVGPPLADRLPTPEPGRPFVVRRG